MGWTVFPPNSRVQVQLLSPESANMDIFGDRDFNQMTELKGQVRGLNPMRLVSLLEEMKMYSGTEGDHVGYSRQVAIHKPRSKPSAGTSPADTQTLGLHNGKQGRICGSSHPDCVTTTLTLSFR